MIPQLLYNPDLISGPCETDNGECEHICIPVGRKAVCKCEYGFTIDSNGRTCSSGTQLYLCRKVSVNKKKKEEKKKKKKRMNLKGQENASNISYIIRFI